MSLLATALLAAALNDTIKRGTQLQEATVTGERVRTETSQIRLKSGTLAGLGTPTGSVESLLRTLPGVVASDELSSQYSVRGGTYDENLVYVNGFELYRPQLARSGQQEGLSVLNPDLVSSLTFTAGGFHAELGDKLSSALEVNYGRSDSTKARVRLGGFSGGATLWHGNLGVSLRYRSNVLFVRTGDVSGDFRADSRDAQIVWSGRHGAWRHEFLGIAQSNGFRLAPTSRTTEFGTVTQVLRLQVAMAGTEFYGFENAFAGWRTRRAFGQRSVLDAEVSWSQALEREHSDVESAYRLGDVNTNMGSDQFGEISYLRGSGGFQRYARNDLWVREFHTALRGNHMINESAQLHWTVGQRVQFAQDRVLEWINLDSAGYSLNHQPTLVVIGPNDTSYVPDSTLELYSVLQSQGELRNIKHWLSSTWSQQWVGPAYSVQLRAGQRLVRDSRSGEWRWSPRASLSVGPTGGGNWLAYLNAGSYAQTASVRELRNWTANGLETDARMQHAWHAIAGTKRYGTRLGRPWMYQVEAYLKYQDRAFAFEQDGMRIRYLGTDPGLAVIYGLDQQLHSTWVGDAESWISLSLFRARERFDDVWQRRGTDYRFAFSMRVEDHLPGQPQNRVYLVTNVTGGFPFGLPLENPKPFKAPPYRRMDLGFERVLPTWRGITPRLALEVYNLLEIRNTASYFWVMDISTASYYAVPNYLTNRLINISLRADL
ncbi:MAG: Plug domain-containing protein [Schleiferiaceae bacterium]